MNKTSLVELEMMKTLLHKKLAKIEEQINDLKGDGNSVRGIQKSIS